MATTQQSGFTPAASPLASTIVQTRTTRLWRLHLYPFTRDNMPAYHARPKQSDGQLPVVIVVQEIFGVHNISATFVAVCAGGVSGYRT
ncbi:putative hydrolase [Escherichia coli]|nr:putative hydrolase [Escherichia coli]